MMRNQQDQKAAARGIFESSQRAIAELGAVIVTFFLTPLIYAHTRVWVLIYTSKYYGQEFIIFVDFVWMMIVGALIFAAARISVSVLVMMGGTMIVMRFLS